LLLAAEINRDLDRDSGLSEPDYDVLSNLSASEGRRRRISELGKRMLWSKSRLSHHITRMERRGLVRREDVASDGRGAFVVLTEDGMRAIEAAAPSHVESVRRHFIDLLTKDEIRALGDIASKVLDHLGAAEDLSPAPTDPVCTTDKQEIEQNSVRSDDDFPSAS
jgi:DNA-binding MarR family transcriptional regulator